MKTGAGESGRSRPGVPRPTRTPCLCSWTQTAAGRGGKRSGLQGELAGSGWSPAFPAEPCVWGLVGSPQLELESLPGWQAGHSAQWEGPHQLSTLMILCSELGRGSGGLFFIRCDWAGRGALCPTGPGTVPRAMAQLFGVPQVFSRWRVRCPGGLWAG